MSQNPKKSRYSQEVEAEVNASFQHNCEESRTSSQSSSEGTPRRKFNFWKNRKAETAHYKAEEKSPFNNLSTGRKMTKLEFRVESISMADTKYGNRLNIKAFDQTGEAELFAFRDVAEQFYQKFKANEAYEIEDYIVKRVYSSTESTQIELLTTTKHLDCPNSDIPKLSFNFVGIPALHKLYAQGQQNTKADFLGIIVRVGNLGKTLTGKAMKTIDLTDRSKENIQLKLWGKEAEKFSANDFDVIAIRQAVLKKYDEEVYLNFQVETAVLINPEIADATNLKDWFNKELDDPMERSVEDEMME